MDCCTSFTIICSIIAHLSKYCNILIIPLDCIIDFYFILNLYIYIHIGLILLTSKSEATVVIADDDVVTVSFSSDTYNVFEDEGHVLLTVTTDVPATQDLSLGIYISADSADGEVLC